MADTRNEKVKGLSRRFSDLSQADTACDYIRALTVIHREVELLLEEGVQNARDDGQSWAETGNALGVTKQSAWRRFAPNPGKGN